MRLSITLNSGISEKKFKLLNNTLSAYFIAVKYFLYS